MDRLYVFLFATDKRFGWFDYIGKLNQLYSVTFWIVLGYFLFGITLAFAQTLPHTPNQLHWVESYKGNLSTQIIMEFSQPIYFKKKILKDNFQLKLTFPGMEQHQFNSRQVIEKISKLKKYGLINNVHVLEKNKNIPKMILILEFAKTRQEVDPNAISQFKKIPNRILIKWCKTEDPYRLIIDIFSQEDLDVLKNQNQIILSAKNDSCVSGLGLFDKKGKLKKKEPRIVLDPGHGGSDYGAKGFNLNEKDIALSIAKKTKTLLQKRGFKVLLTRNNDEDMPIAERSELAEQLKANLFVSIHVNSDGGRNLGANGIETFYLDTKEYVMPTLRGGFLFMNTNRDPSLFRLIDNYLNNNAQVSYHLAQQIQNSLMCHMLEHNYDVTNRGVKSKGFMRVLLRSSVPAALVEVGFITNRQEAILLSNKDYQSNIASGIDSGIFKFVSQQN